MHATSMLLPYLHSAFSLPERLLRSHDEAAEAAEARRLLELMDHLGRVENITGSNLQGIKALAGDRPRL